MARRSDLSVEALQQKVSGLVAFLDSGRKASDHAPRSDSAGRAHRRDRADDRGSRTSRQPREERRPRSGSRRRTSTHDDRRAKDRSIRHSRSRSPRGGGRRRRSPSRPIAGKQEHAAHERHHHTNGSSSALPGRESVRAALKEQPHVQVDGPNDEHKFRASHRRVTSATSTGRHATICDLVVLGPWRTRREAADDDAKGLQSAFEKKGEDGVLQAVAAMWTPLMHPSWPSTSSSRIPGLRGWQLEVENSDDGNRRCRAVCVLDTSRSRPSATPTTVNGQWRPSRVRAEEDAMYILAEYQHHGLSAALKAAFGHSSASSTAQPSLPQSGIDGHTHSRPHVQQPDRRSSPSRSHGSDRLPKGPAPPPGSERRLPSPAPAGTTMVVKSKGAPPLLPFAQRGAPPMMPPSRLAPSPPAMMPPPPNRSPPSPPASMMAPPPQQSANQSPIERRHNPLPQQKASQPPIERRNNGGLPEGSSSSTEATTLRAAPWRQASSSHRTVFRKIDAGNRGEASGGTKNPSSAPLPRRTALPKGKATPQAQPGASTPRPVLPRPRFVAKAKAGESDSKPMRKVFLRSAASVATPTLKRPLAAKGNPKATALSKYAERRLSKSQRDALKAKLSPKATGPPATARESLMNDSDDDWGGWTGEAEADSPSEGVQPAEQSYVASPAPAGVNGSQQPGADDDWGAWKSSRQHSAEASGMPQADYAWWERPPGDWTATPREKAAAPAPKAASPSAAKAASPSSAPTSSVRPYRAATGHGRIQPLAASAGRVRPSAPKAAPSRSRSVPTKASSVTGPPIKPQPPKHPPPSSMMHRKPSASQAPPGREAPQPAPRQEEKAEDEPGEDGLSAFETLGEVWKLL